MRLQHTGPVPGEASEVRGGTPRERAAAPGPPHDDGGCGELAPMSPVSGIL